MDFVSPENVRECIRLTEEFRKLPRYHGAREDKLEVMQLTLDSWSWLIPKSNLWELHL